MGATLVALTTAEAAVSVASNQPNDLVPRCRGVEPLLSGPEGARPRGAGRARAFGQAAQAALLFGAGAVLPAAGCRRCQELLKDFLLKPFKKGYRMK